MLKKYHTRLNITNNIKVCDEVSLELKKKEILNTIFEEYYLSPTKEFTRLINDFCLKDDKDLKGHFEELYKKHDKISLGYEENDVASPSDMRKYYSFEDTIKNGVVAIEIEVI